MKYEVSGDIKMGIKSRKFNFNVEANSEGHAKTKTYAHFGAKNKLKKGNVVVKNIKEVK
ncbi:hypothetical protein KO465_03680 [Candidatus Micrarchaeota archaeon]|nr:hypothetical protein [Candidatus Micrarchaeota archaeon]